jgi:Flp pilus assembly pilin Flp
MDISATSSGRARRFCSDELGQTTVEWALLLVVFGLPMIYVIGLLLRVLTEQYRMVTFLETLPLP